MSSLPIKGVNFHLKPQAAWIAIIGLICFSVLLILSGAGSLMNVLFPLAAFAVGIFLYFRAPMIYVGFTWWLWFLVPVVRRLSDWRSYYNDPSPILLAPYLVTLITLVTLWRNLPRIHREGGFPFILSLTAIFYGIVVGFIFRPFNSLAINTLDWLIPVIFGFHLFVHWRDYPSYRQNILRVFFWGVLVMGIYGIFQFILSPPWDVFWLVQTDFASGAIGRAENIQPFSINVWSTMTSNRPFGTVMMAGLILLLVNDSKGKLGLPATLVGYLSFLLARKRTTWFSWLVALLLLLSSLKAKTQRRIIVALIIGAICLIPLSTIEPFSGFIYSRFESFSELENDNSANARLGTFQELSDQALTSFFGQGIGGRSYDSGILSTLLDLGWLGTIFYIGGIVLLFLSLYYKKTKIHDNFIYAARAISISVFIQLPLGRSHVEAQGIILWSFLSLAVAGQQYYLRGNNRQKYIQDTS